MTPRYPRAAPPLSLRPPTLLERGLAIGLVLVLVVGYFACVYSVVVRGLVDGGAGYFWGGLGMTVGWSWLVVFAFRGAR